MKHCDFFIDPEKDRQSASCVLIAKVFFFLFQIFYIELKMVRFILN